MAGEPMQDGLNTHRYTTANHITSWTVIPLHDPVTAIKHYYHVPTVVVEEIERSALAPASMPEDACRYCGELTAACRLIPETKCCPDCTHLAATPSPEPLPREALDVERLLATLRDRFHEARAGTPEWRDGIRLGLEIAMNEVSYAAVPEFLAALSPDRPTPP